MPNIHHVLKQPEGPDWQAQKEDKTKLTAKDLEESANQENDGTIDLLNFVPKEFDRAKEVNKDDFDLVFGKRRAGKSHWTRFEIEEIADIYAEVYVFTNTTQNLLWTNHAPAARIYQGLEGQSAEVLQSIIDAQIRKRDDIVAWMYKNKIKKVPYVPLIMIILDDVLNSETLNRFNALLNYLVYNGRHIDISLKMLLQDPTGAPPAWRLNADKVACTFSTQKRFVRMIHEGYFPFVPLIDFVKFYHKHTQKYQLLIFLQNDKVSSDDIQGLVRVSRATKKIKPYQIGFNKFWDDCDCDLKTQVEQFKYMKILTDLDIKDLRKLAREEQRRYEEQNHRKKTIANNKYVPESNLGPGSLLMPNSGADISEWAAERVENIGKSQFTYYKGKNRINKFY